VLQNAVNTPDGWKNICYGHDYGDHCSDYDKFVFRSKSMFLSLSYKFALNNMGDGSSNWAKCCQDSVAYLNKIGIQYTNSSQIVQRWNVVFKSTGLFPHPRPDQMMGKRWEPPFFESCPEAKEILRQYCKANLATLTLERIQEFIGGELLKELEAKGKVDDGYREFVENYKAKARFWLLVEGLCDANQPPFEGRPIPNCVGGGRSRCKDEPPNFYVCDGRS
jgi:hypothetical protein